MCLQAPPADTNAVDHVNALGGLYINTPSTTKHFLLLEIFTGNTCECIAVVLGRVVDQTIVDCKNYLYASHEALPL